MTLDEVNTLSHHGFVQLFGGVYEHSPWVAEKVAAQRPFSNQAILLRAFIEAVDTATRSQQDALIHAHPELGQKPVVHGAEGAPVVLSAASQAEQKRVGLDCLSVEAETRLGQLNEAYRRKFAMPFIICVRQVGKAAMLDEMVRRLAGTIEDEHREALTQIHAIAALRIKDIVQT